MKKILLIAALLFGFTATQAQTLEGSKFFDNWSVTLKGGSVHPFKNYAFWGSGRGIVGLELRKQINPVFGLGFEGSTSVNTSAWDKNTLGHASVYGPHSANVFDHSIVGVFGTVNLFNLFGGYNGTPRLFEIEAVYGTGWWHAYRPTSSEPTLYEATTHDANAWYNKVGLNFNFNLGESKAWTIAFKPAIVWNMDYENATGRDTHYKGASRFDANGATVELEAGLTYHFKNSNGEHYFTLCPYKYTQNDIDQLNAKVNDLRSQLSDAQSQLNDAKSRNAQLQNDLNACRAQKNKVVEVKSNSESLETNVFFQQGKSVITNAQMPNVERVATFMKNHKDTKVVIKGYASPEGSKEINEKIARDRANAVKDALVKKYKIAASRITAEGQGVGDMFSEPDWNRVSICTLITKDK